MTDSQLLTAAIAVIVPVSLLIDSNSKVNDAKGTLRAEMKLGFAQVTHAIENLQAALKVHELEHHSK